MLSSRRVKNSAQQETDEESDIYEVERILDSRIRNGKKEYFIQWLGFGSEEESWEPLSHLQNALEMVEKFEEKSSKQPAKGRTRSASRGRKTSPANKRSPSKSRKSSPIKKKSPSKSRSTSRGRPSKAKSSSSRAPSKVRTASKGRSQSRGRSASPKRKVQVKRQASPRKTSTPNKTESAYVRARAALKKLPLTSAGGTPPRSSFRLATRSVTNGQPASISQPRAPSRSYRRARQPWWNVRKANLPLILFVACLLIVAGTLVYYRRDSISGVLAKWRRR